MLSSDEYKNLTPDDRRFIQRVAEHYTPASLSAARQATFDRKLEERLAGSARLPFLRPASLLVPICAALLLWFALPSQRASSPNFKDFTPPSAPSTLAQDTSGAGPSDTQDTPSHSNLLTYAYDQSEAYTDFLPDEYMALADAFELL